MKDYLEDINNYFGRRLVKPDGLTSIGKNEILNHESLELNLMELVLLREEGINRNSNTLLNKIKNYIKNFVFEEDNSLVKMHKMKTDYDIIKDLKYQALFKEFKENKSSYI